jgi:exopolysaccharide production protein ExoQ
MNGTRRLFELLALGGSALILSGGLLSMVLDTGGTAMALDGSPAWRLVLGISYLGVALVLLPWYRETFFVLRRNWALVSLLVLAVLSSLWAEMPGLVLRKAIGLFGTTLLGIALALRVSFEEQLRMLRWLFRILAVLSLACVVLFPSYGISSEGEWKGVFGYKNAMGTALGLSLLVEWQLPSVTRLSRVLKILAMLLYTVLLLHSDSVTPAVAFVGAVILLNIYKFAALRLRVPLYAFFVITAILVSVGLSFVLANSDRVMGLLGRSSNLTGRTEIWSLVISFIPQRPILGYGYSGFWLGASPESFVVNRVLGGPVMYSHNGYLEMLLSLGAIGLLLTLVLIGTGIKRALYLSRQRQLGMELWPLAFLLYFIFHNLGEVTIAMQLLEWPMCISCIVGTDLLLLAYRAEEQAEFALIPLEELG